MKDIIKKLEQHLQIIESCSAKIKDYTEDRFIKNKSISINSEAILAIELLKELKNTQS